MIKNADLRIRLGTFLLSVSVLLITGVPTSVQADQTKWISIGMLHNWFSSAGSEIEVGRRHLISDQQDGLQWPALYRYQDMQAAKGLWIGGKNFYDPIAGKQFNTKVVHIGPRVLDESSESIPQKFALIGKFDHPTVVVDGVLGSHTAYKDIVDEIDPSLPSDRMLDNIVNTSIGITIHRKIYAYSNPYHDNYFIYEYVFKNTGIYNKNGDVYEQTLEDVIFFFQFRYAISKHMGAYGYYYGPQSATWGHNTMNDVWHPGYGDDIRAIYAWHGLHSGYSGDNIGGPNNGGGTIPADGFLGAAQFPGVVTLHADKSVSDKSDDNNQPFSTPYFSSDAAITSGNDQFNEASMEAEYTVMNTGLPSQTHAERVGDGNADEWAPSGGQNPGGFSQGIGYGPYTLAPGDSIRIVLAEGADGLSWEKRHEIGAQWYDQTTPYILPNGDETSDRNQFKDSWVFTGVDSIRKTFERAIQTWENGLVVDPAPPPPNTFTVTSGGDRIILEWSENAESYPNFGGYRAYRSMHTADTTFEKIFECGLGTDHPEIVNEYDDRNARRGFDYYYYITTFDDGTINTIEPGKEIESSLFWTKTNEPAYLRRQPGDNLEDIRIVPNPYNINARSLQFGESGPDRIMFYNLPPKCDIKIFTERGDLIQTIHHTDGSGDEPWNSITSSRQVVVSGIYIAYIKVTEDHQDPDTGKMLYRKGDATIKKLIIVR